MRVYIVGAPGSGKTSLARALGREFGLSLLELDHLWGRLFDRDASGRITEAAILSRAQLVAEYVVRDGWVIEGAEPPFLHELANVSDLIVWCDVPFRTAAARLLRRHVIADLKRNNRYPGYRRLFRFLRSVRRRYGAPLEPSSDDWTTWTRARVERAVRPYEAKLVKVTSGSVWENYLRVKERVGGTTRERPLMKQDQRPQQSAPTSARLIRVAARWGVTLLEPYPDVYPGNLVYRCALRDGTPAVIKHEPPRTRDDEFPTGIDALIHYGGRGMVRLLEVAREERVILTERVVPGRPLWEVPMPESLEAIASVMSKLRKALPDPNLFPSVAAYYRAWPNHRRLYGGSGPIDRDLFDIGEQLFLELCDASAGPVVLHGDLHYGNVLSSDREGWLAIDPKGLSGEPCYEVGALFRNRIDELYASSDPIQAMRRRVEALADLTGFDRERVRLWALSQAVLSEVWSADDPSKTLRIDMRAARLLHAIGPLG
ncbi:MAG: aminoglycoside phosphotransferase family protein [Candidatus Limnocylindria bacterium]